MNRTLFLKECKGNWLLWVIFAGVLTMYAVMITTMFDPKLGDSLKAMADSMPGIFAAFGMLNVGTTLLEFLIGYLYGILFLAFPAVYIIILSNRLIARYVDKGAMAYLLAAPIKRRKIAGTQALYLIGSILGMVAYLTVLLIVASQNLFQGELDIQKFLYVNIGLLAMQLFLAGICFLASCIFDDTKLSNGVSAAVVIASILIQMISQVGDKFEKLKYATPLTLFDPKGLAAVHSQAVQNCLILYVGAAVFFGAGIFIFSRRNISV